MVLHTYIFLLFPYRYIFYKYIRNGACLRFFEKRHIKCLLCVDESLTFFFWMVLLFWWNSRLNLKFHLNLFLSIFSSFLLHVFGVKDVCHFFFFSWRIQWRRQIDGNDFGFCSLTYKTNEKEVILSFLIIHWMYFSMFFFYSDMQNGFLGVYENKYFCD